MGGEPEAARVHLPFLVPRGRAIRAQSRFASRLPAPDGGQGPGRYQEARTHDDCKGLVENERTTQTGTEIDQGQAFVNAVRNPHLRFRRQLWVTAPPSQRTALSPICNNQY